MALNRRQMIAAAGGGAVLVGAGGWWWSRDRLPQDEPLTDATRAWDTRGKGPADMRLDALRHAILAPSAGNRQPWRMRLEAEDAVFLHADPSRLLGPADPGDRCSLLSLGAFAEFVGLAASGRGRRTQIDAFPDGAGEALGEQPVARLTFTHDGVAPDPIQAMIPWRRTQRQAFDMGPLPDDQPYFTAEADDASVRLVTDPGLLKPIAELLADASDRERQATGGRSFRPLEVRDLPAVLLVLTRADDLPARFHAGRAYGRSSLVAVTRGLGLEPLTAILRGDALMDTPRDALHALLGTDGARIQMLARIGRGPRNPRTPRDPLADRLISA